MSVERNHRSNIENIKPESHREKSNNHLLDSAKHSELKATDSGKNHGAQKHLPTLEIVDHKRLQDKVVDQSHKHKAEDRLHAAHKLYKNHHSQFSANDKNGKTHHYQIVEKPIEKTKNIKVAVFEIEGKKLRLALHGTMKPDGNFENVKDLDLPRKREQKRERKIETERDNIDDQPEHRRHRRHRHHASESHSRDIEKVRPTLDNRTARETLNTAARLDLPSDRLIKLNNGLVYLRSKLAVDADGGSDWRKDPYGQATTSLTNADGSALDANKVNYFVLPMTDEYKQLGIKLGDLAWVRNVTNGKMVAAIFGDLGPQRKIGEGSQALCRALGLSGNPLHGGTDKKEIEFLIQPNSGNGRGDIAKNPDAMVARLNPVQRPFNSDNTDNETGIAAKIVASAKLAEGKKLWTEQAKATKNGRLGCAISTSEVLEDAGLDIDKETGACALVEQLQDRGWDKIAVWQAQPGDVIYGARPGTNAAKGGGNAHVGIVGEDKAGKLMVYANVSATGRWTYEAAKRAFSPNRFGDQVWAFRPPQTAQA